MGKTTREIYEEAEETRGAVQAVSWSALDNACDTMVERGEGEERFIYGGVPSDALLQWWRSSVQGILTNGETPAQAIAWFERRGIVG